MGNPATKIHSGVIKHGEKFIQLDPTSSSNVHQLVILWLLNIAMENCPFIDGLPINSMVDLSIAMLNNQRVTSIYMFDMFT